MTTVHIPITKPLVGDSEYERVKAVLDSGWLTQGEETFEFERLVASYCCAKHAVAMNSATTALHIALLLLGIGHGDEVVVPSYSHIATANAVTYTGAKPVFVDIRRSTYNLDERFLDELITERTKAVVVVHQVGLPVDLEAVAAVTRQHDLHLIEDAACALGSEYAGRRIGGHGNIAVLSFHPRKVITTGEGGMILTDNPEFARIARSLASHGESVLDLHRHNSMRPTTEEFSRVGFNYRLTNIQGAIGVEQMSRLENILQARRALAHRYTRQLEAVPGIEVPIEPAGCTPNYQSYMIRITPEAGATRDHVMIRLHEAGIATRPGITAIHREPPYRDHADRSKLRETERALEEALILPLYPQLQEEEQNDVIRTLTHLATGELR
jgi:dTDP-4-amino-4,6-dideoxygalactose transaminase